MRTHIAEDEDTDAASLCPRSISSMSIYRAVDEDGVTDAASPRSIKPLVRLHEGSIKTSLRLY
jgi:hypothetical protein